MSATAWLALIAIWLIGMLIASLCLGRRTRVAGRWPLLAGAGFLLGASLTGNLLWMQGPASLGDALAGALLWLALLGVLLGLFWWRRPRNAALAGRGGGRVERLPGWLGWASFTLLALAFVAISVQALSLPVLSWDAWNAWLAKSKGWYYAGQFLPVLGMDAWLAAAPGSAIANITPGYPEALPRLVTVLALLCGEWQDGQVALLWPLLWLAGAAMFAGALRQRGAGFAQAMACAAALFCLPLLSAHAVLSGYMDLWLGLLVLLAVVMGDAWQRNRERSSLAGFLVCLVLLPTIKLEGGVYSLLLAAGFAFWQVPLRVRWLLAAAALLVVLPIWWWFGISLPLPGLGWVRLHPDEVSLPLIGTLQLAWRPVAPVVLQSLFVLPNWSLLWFAAPLVMLARWRQLPGLAAPASFLLGAAAFHFCLFFLTDASAWAENLTSLNRLLLHVAPAWGWLLAVLVIPAQGIRGRYG